MCNRIANEENTKRKQLRRKRKFLENMALFIKIGEALEAERIAASARKINIAERMIRDKEQRLLFKATLLTNVYCVIEKPLRKTRK